MLGNSEISAIILAMIVLNIVVYILGQLIKYLRIHTSQKITFYKFGLICQMITPIFSALFLLMQWKPIEIVLNPSNPSNNKLSDKINIMPSDFNWLTLFISFYFLILAIQFSFIFYVYLRTLFRLKKIQGVNIEGQIICMDPNFSSPFCFGVLKPRIFFPNFLIQNGDHETLRMALVHEQHHMIHFDPLWKLLFLLLRCSLFFVPTAYFFTETLKPS